MFSKYQIGQKRVNGVTIHYRMGGAGPALLLLHGHPQNHVMWHKVADELADNFTVVAADLRGYGDSDKPLGDKNGTSYTKREMAKDQCQLMAALGFSSFHILAHDRGARVAHRLAMDFPESVNKLILLDIAPTLAMYRQTNEQFARAYWHWFFLVRPAPLPETLLEADPENYLHSVMGARSAGMQPFTQQALAEYLRCLRLPGTARGICEDYRASAGMDLQHDQDDITANNKITCPLLILWGEEGTVGKCFNPLAEWQKLALHAKGQALPSGHYIAEEIPSVLLEHVYAFLKPELPLNNGNYHVDA
ncbi:alpha/beta fold hydrolase [Agaribacter flavus]|uniref:Alpha/beta fold hydrolase n=1 Tax=Agaribacter flavus TaxID=1902781 RepID=A0ABV7FV20_9ALTE